MNKSDEPLPDKTLGQAVKTAVASEIKPATGFGPNSRGVFSQEDYHDPAAGWGAAISVSKVLVKQHELINGTRVVFKMNHENGGYDCPGCAWPDDREGLRMDICENGIKHATWELTSKRASRDFFAAYTITELMEWTDFALENAGRLTEPMRYDSSSDKYVPVTWDEAFALAGCNFCNLKNPNQAAFYTSGRLSNEATFPYQLFARELGTNNLPDCSNMCHEASGRVLSASIGTGKGTVDLIDWEKTDCLVILGVNAASNSPRMLTSLAKAYRRGAQIVHVNPFIEAASRRTIVPHEILNMALFHSTPVGTLDVQPSIFMNQDDMEERGLKKFDLVDMTSFAKDGSTRHLYGFRAIPYNMPRGCAMGYMPELNVLCPIGDYSIQSDQPLMKHVLVEIRPSVTSAPKET